MTVISVSHQRVNCVILHIISCDQDCQCNNFLTMHQKGLQGKEMKVISASHQRVNCFISHLINCDQDCQCNNIFF